MNDDGDKLDGMATILRLSVDDRLDNSLGTSHDIYVYKATTPDSKG